MTSYTVNSGSTTSHYLSGPPIPDGSRNVTLTSIAGGLHDGTRSLEQFTRDLMAVNKARCRPALPYSEVRGIARKIHRLTPCKPSKGRPPEEVIDFVSRHRVGVLEARAWKGQAGASNQKVYEALLRLAERHGWQSKAGNVCVSVSVRELARRAGVSTKTCHAALKRLQKERLTYRIPRVTNGTAGALTLRDVASVTQVVNSQSPKESLLSVNGLSEILLRFRHGAGRLTPTRVRHLRALLLLGGEATAQEVAERVRLRRDNVRRTLRYLEERELVKFCGEDRYRVVPDLPDALLRVLVEDGVPESERAQEFKDAYERYRYAEYRASKTRSQSEPKLSGTSRHHGQLAVVVPLIDFSGEVFEPEDVRVEPQPAFVRNLPPKGEDGVYRHGPDCACWICGEDAPEWVLADMLAGVAA
jgi:DNA-binding MarR family transcriptional regulator